MIKLVDVCKTYPNGYTALKNINIQFDTHGLVCVVGTSGAGKSTLVNILGGNDDITSGTMFFNEIEVCKKNMDKYRDSHIANIFQDFKLIENLSVSKNIMLANDSLTRQEILLLLKKTRLKSVFFDKKVKKLSLGEKQRVAICRALAKNCEILLCDEPTANLDENNAKNIFEILKEIALTKLVVVVTHNVALAKEFADTIVEIEDGVVKNTYSQNSKEIQQGEEPSGAESNLNNLSKRKNLRLKTILSVGLSQSCSVLTILMCFAFFVILLSCFVMTSLYRCDKLSLFKRVFDKAPSKVVVVGSEERLPDDVLEFGKHGYATYLSFDKNVVDFEQNLQNAKYFDCLSNNDFYASLILCNNPQTLDMQLVAGKEVSDKNQMIISEYLANNIVRVGKLNEKNITNINDILGEKLIDNFVVVGVFKTYYEKISSEYKTQEYLKTHLMPSMEEESIKLLFELDIDANAIFVSEKYSNQDIQEWLEVARPNQVAFKANYNKINKVYEVLKANQLHKVVGLKTVNSWNLLVYENAIAKKPIMICFLVLTIIMMVIFMFAQSYSVVLANRKSIVIFRSVGVKKFDIIKVFLVNQILLLFAILLVSMVCYPFVLNAINSMIGYMGVDILVSAYGLNVTAMITIPISILLLLFLVQGLVVKSSYKSSVVKEYNKF